jgi:hypothetical protein
MKSKNLWIGLAAIVVIAVNGGLAHPLPSEVQEVSLVALIANAKQYQGQYIRVTGYLQYEDEEAILYLTAADSKNDITKNGIWLYLEPKIKNPGRLSNRYVFVQGTFSAKNQGRWDYCSGSLESVDRLEDNKPHGTFRHLKN